MRYSLRSLMIVVTLVALVLGRIVYLRQRADYHNQQWHLEEKAGKWGLEGAEGREARAEEMRHMLLIVRFRRAVYRPWTIVDESPPQEDCTDSEVQEIRKLFFEELDAGRISGIPGYNEREEL